MEAHRAVSETLVSLWDLKITIPFAAADPKGACGTTGEVRVVCLMPAPHASPFGGGGVNSLGLVFAPAPSGEGGGGAQPVLSE